MSVYDDLARFKPDGLTFNGWAVLAGVSRTVWSDIRRHDNPSRRTMEKLLAAAGSSLAQFEALRIGTGGGDARVGSSASLAEHGARAWRSAPLLPIPVFHSTSSAIPWGTTCTECLMLDRSNMVSSVARPASLASDPGAFALTIPDERMWPRFREGRRIIVTSATDAVIGDDVLVTRPLADRDDCELAVIGDLAARSPGRIALRQFTPPRQVDLEIVAGDTVLKIVGEAI